MKSLYAPLIVSFVCVTVAVSGSNAWEGFGWGKPAPFSGRAVQADDDGFSLVPKRTVKQAPRTPLLTKIGRTTKTAFTKTVDFLTPWRKTSKMPPSQPRLTGSQRVYHGSSYSSEKDKKPSWFARLVGYDEPETDRVDTAVDFLGQPRVGM